MNGGDGAISSLDALGPSEASLLIAVAAGAVFALGWFPLRSRLPHLQPLQPSKVIENGPMVFVLGFFVTLMTGLVIATLLGVGAGDDPASLKPAMTAQTLANVFGVGLMVYVATRRPDGAASVGLTAHRGPSAWIVGPCAWLAYLPVLLVVVVLNDWMHTEFGWQRESQRALQLFLDDEGNRRSVWIWLSIGVFNPFLEEVAFRGVLYGGLRRAFPAPTAMGFSAAIFASLHGPTNFLPVAALGVLMAWLYERTGSLKAPTIAHALHNAATLLMVTRGVPI